MERRLSSFRLPSLALLCALALVSCETGPVGGVSFSLDPAGIFDPGVLDPAALRIIIFPAAGVPRCEPASGRLGDPLSEPSTAPAATFDDAVVDVVLPLTPGGAERMGQSFELPAGTYTILIRGRGMDRVTNELDQVVASGCATDSIAAGGTKGVTITMHEVTGMGTCGNAMVSPDEQCDDGNTTPGDGCGATCQTEAFPINVTDVNNVQQAASVAWGAGSGDTARAIVAYQSDSVGLGMRFLSDIGAGLPAPLDRDVVADNRAGAQLDVATAVGGGRVLLAYRDAFPNDAASDVRVRSFRIDAPTAGGTPATEATLATQAAPALDATGHPESDGRQAAPAVAVLADGNGLVVFENPQSATGLSGRVYAPTATVGTGAGAFELGTGSTGGQSPVAAAASSGFLVAYLAGASVFVQTVDSAGTAGTPMSVAAHSGGGAPVLAIGALTSCAAAGGCALLAWQDGAVGGLSAIVVAADGTAVGGAFTVAEADHAGTNPTVGGGDRFVVGFAAADGVRARIFDAGGAPAFNRERPQTSGSFLVAAGGSAPSVAAGGRPNAFVPPTTSYLVVWDDPTQDASGGVRGRAIPF